MSLEIVTKASLIRGGRSAPGSRVTIYGDCGRAGGEAEVDMPEPGFLSCSPQGPTQTKESKL